MKDKTPNNSANSDNLPDVYKQAELEAMLELISAGLWRSTNLANALHVDLNTIAAWKRRPEVQEAHKRAIVKFARRRTDVEKILSELEVESTPDISSLNQFNIYGQMSDEQLDKFIRSKGAEVGVSSTIAGETTQNDGESPEVRETTPETN